MKYSTQSSHATKYHHVFLSLDAHISNQQQQQQQQPMTHHQLDGYQQQEQTPWWFSGFIPHGS